jgi:membrane associated rhomboid family serine protease
MQDSNGLMSAFARPGKALVGLMLVITTLWLMFAVGLNWGGAPEGVFFLLAGDTKAILHGEVWRLFTAPLLHTPSGGNGVWHLVGALLGLFIFAPMLETTWGGARLLRFIAISSIAAYALQMLFELLLPSQLGARLVGPYWYGLDPAIAALAIAWACSRRGQPINLLFIGAVSSRTMILIVVAFPFLRLVAGSQPEEGLLSPFFGMLVGWGIGGGTPSPIRKAWLKLRLAQLEGRQGSGSRHPGGPRKARPNPGGLRVIPGGRTDDDDDKGPDGRWLN